jgi:hypothetical protein
MPPAPRQRNKPASVFVRGFLLFFFLASASVVHAASGTILSSSKYAWSNVGGWVNFAPTNSTVTVTDSVLTGYVWSANDGWINLSPSNSGVTNSTSGTLGGFAWDQAAGWVSFMGVSIDSNGKFHGQATGSNGYVINFDCSSCNVTTSWRYSTTTTPVNVSPGSISPVYIPPSVSSAGNTSPATEPPFGQVPPAPSAPTSGTPGTSSGGTTYPSGNVFPTNVIPTNAIPPLATSTNLLKKTSIVASTTKPASIPSFWRSTVLPVVAGFSLLAILMVVWWLFL